MAGHIALRAAPGLRRRRRGPGAHRPRQRRGEGQRDLASSVRSTRRATNVVTPASRSSTSASTSARWSARCSPGCCRGVGLPLRASPSPRSAWRPASCSTRSVAQSCPTRRTTVPNPLPARRAPEVRRRAGASPSWRSSCWRSTGVHHRGPAGHDRGRGRAGSRRRSLLRRDPAQPRDHRRRSAAGLRVHPDVPVPARCSGRSTSSSSRCVTIYSDKRLDRDLFGWEMPVSWVQSINPVMIIVLVRCLRRRCGPSSVTGSRRRR